MLAYEPVNRFMTEAVLTIDINAPAGEILRLFARYPVHHLPVVDNAKVVGMLSSADLLKLEKFIPVHCTSREQYLDRAANVATIMRRPVISVLSSQSLEHAASLMVSHGIHALPVIDRNDRLVGIITTTDIMHAALQPERRGDATEESSVTAVTFGMSVAEVDRALHLARAAAEENNDNGMIARALLYVQSHRRFLENVLTCADRYLRAGQDVRLHSELTKAIEAARRDRGDLTQAVDL